MPRFEYDEFVAMQVGADGAALESFPLMPVQRLMADSFPSQAAASDAMLEEGRRRIWSNGAYWAGPNDYAFAPHPADIMECTARRKHFFECQEVYLQTMLTDEVELLAVVNRDLALRFNAHETAPSNCPAPPEADIAWVEGLKKHVAQVREWLAACQRELGVDEATKEARTFPNRERQAEERARVAELRGRAMSLSLSE